MSGQGLGEVPREEPGSGGLGGSSGRGYRPYPSYSVAGFVPHFGTPINPPPALWFYRCNNCNVMLPIEKLRLPPTVQYDRRLVSVEITDMLLCRSCRREYRQWGYGIGKGSPDRRRQSVIHPLLSSSTPHNRWRLLMRRYMGKGYPSDGKWGVAQ